MSINYHNAKFIISAEKISQCPKTIKAEIAFIGRSNVGKSSALNVLTNSKKNARTSKTPGRTQLINYFDLGNELCLVDLPGYGYAKVSNQIKEKWQFYLSEYLQKRQQLKGLILLVDIRHPIKEYDIEMLKWSSTKLPIHILLTKADKLKYGASQNSLNAMITFCKEHQYHTSVQLFSALKKQGVSKLTEKLDDWFTAAT